MPLNLDDLIGSMQSVHAGDRGQGIEEIREKLKTTLGQAATGPLRMDGSAYHSGSGAIRMNGTYGRYNTGASASGSGSGASSTSKKRRMLHRGGYPQHHHANQSSLQMRQHPHYSSPSHSTSRERSRGGTRMMGEAIGGQQSAAVDEEDDSMGDATTVGDDGGGSSYFAANYQRGFSGSSSHNGDLNIPYPSPVNGINSSTQTHSQRFPSTTDMALSPATSSYPRSYTSNTSAGLSSVTSTSASSHSGTGSSGFYEIGTGAAPPANTPQQTPSDRGNAMPMHSIMRPGTAGGDILWEGNGAEGVETVAPTSYADAGATDSDLFDEEQDGIAEPASRFLASPRHERRESEVRGPGALEVSRPASSSPRKLVNGFMPAIQS